MKAPEMNDEFDTFLKSSIDIDVPPQLEARLRQRLVEFEDRMKESDRSGEKKTSHLYQVLQSKKALWTAVTSLAATLCLILLSMSFLGGGAKLAFADVIEQCSRFRPYSCQVTVERQGNCITKKVSHQSTTRRREVRSDGMIIILDLASTPPRSLALYTKDMTAFEKKYTGLNATQSPDLVKIITDMQTDQTQPIENLGEKIIAGKTAKGFHRPGEINDFTIWADVETGLPLMIKLLHPQIDQEIIMTDFDFQTQFDPELFNMTPPDGYTLHQQTVPPSTQSTTPQPFKPYSCKETIFRNNQKILESTILHLDPYHSRTIRKEGIQVKDLSGEHPILMILDPAEKKAIITTMTSRKGPMKDIDLLTMALNIKKSSNKEDLGSKVIEGRKATGFSAVRPGNELTFWLDDETQLLLQAEIVHTNAGRRILMEEFDYTTELDPSLFEITTPEGYSVERKTKP